jgi:hypothetical protein
MRRHSKYQDLVAINRKLAKQLWGDALNPLQRRSLSEITRSYGFSIATRDMLLLEGGWYVTHSGLIRLAKRSYCFGIDVEAVRDFCDPIAARWAFKATVYKSKGSTGFVGHGDANPSNVSALVRGAEMRVAETRAVNRALRKAYGIGLCSVEELGSFSGSSQTAAPPHSNGRHNSNGSSNGQPRLRDQLCLLIRQYNLDPTLVKAYAADFCGTATLKEASRDLVESFISELATAAKSDRDSLLCKLNSYAQSTEAKP